MQEEHYLDFLPAFLSFYVHSNHFSTALFLIQPLLENILHCLSFIL